VSKNPTGKSFTQAINEAQQRRIGEPKGETVRKDTQQDTQQNVQPEPPKSISPLNPLSERLARLRALAQQPTATAASEPVATVPDTSADAPDPGNTELSADEQMLDSVINGLDIVDMYNRWCDKAKVNPGNRRESIKCSCPNPSHPDKNPSAWMNREKGTGYCSGCNIGFDLWDIAAYRFGYPVPGYKTDKKMFRQLRDSIASDLGYAKYTTAGKTTYAKQNETQSESEAAPSTDSSLQDPCTNVVQLHAVAALPPDDEVASGPELKTASLDWRPLCAEGTFLDEWMRECTKDTCPEEFHFFDGLLAVGAAVGRNRTLSDIPEVTANLNVCLVGKSGTGKSRAKRHLRGLLHSALPFDPDVPFPTGTKIINPGSGEALIKEFEHLESDPYNPQAQKKLWPVRGYIEFDEMATLVTKGQRLGSSLKTLLMELYDAPQVLANTTVGGGRVIADRPFGLVMTTTQNRSIRGLLTASDSSSGFVNRWVFVTGPPKPQVSINTQILDFEPAVQLLKSIHAWATNAVKLTFTPSAFKLFDDFILKKVLPAKDKAEDNSDIFSRMDLLLKKIVVLLACNEKKTVIDDVVVERMILMYPYLCEVYGVVDMHMAESIAGEMATLVHGVIKSFQQRNNNKSPTSREIMQRLAPNKRDVEQLNKTLKLMCDLGIIEKEETRGKRGPATVRFGVAV
jgi:hypothetical protein